MGHFMRLGYQHLIEALRLLATPELADGVEWIELQRANGAFNRCTRIVFDPPVGTNASIYARVIPTETTGAEAAWIMVPTDELVGIAIGFGATARTTELPTLLTDLRSASKKAKKSAA
jgi:hypothetical protein